jgi:hypothetical protein
VPATTSGDEGSPLVKRAEEPRENESDDSAQRRQQEASWRGRAQAARVAVAAAERELRAAEQAKASMGIGPQVDDSELRRAFADQVKAADQRVKSAQNAVAVAKANQANLEEEARRTGAQPGWLR